MMTGLKSSTSIWINQRNFLADTATNHHLDQWFHQREQLVWKCIFTPTVRVSFLALKEDTSSCKPKMNLETAEETSLTVKMGSSKVQTIQKNIQVMVPCNVTGLFMFHQDTRFCCILMILRWRATLQTVDAP